MLVLSPLPQFGSLGPVEILCSKAVFSGSWLVLVGSISIIMRASWVSCTLFEITELVRTVVNINTLNPANNLVN